MEKIIDSRNNFREISCLILDKIDGNTYYFVNKHKHNEYLYDNPYVAKKKGINLYSSKIKDTAGRLIMINDLEADITVFIFNGQRYFSLSQEDSVSKK